MKNLSIILIAMLCMANGCPPERTIDPSIKKNKPLVIYQIDLRPTSVDQDMFYEIRYDSCEYLIYTSSGGYGIIPLAMTHKGNCSNPTHHNP